VRSSSKIASSPFFKKGEEHNFDRTTSAEEQFVLQKKAIRFERFKDAAFPEKEYEIYSRGGEKSPLATKNKPNWKKYKNWTEAAEDVVFRNLPANVSQHDIMRHHGVKHRKHLNTRYMFDKTMLSKLSNAFPSKYIRDKHVIELYPGFGLLSLRFLRKEPLSYTFVEPDKSCQIASKCSAVFAGQRRRCSGLENGAPRSSTRSTAFRQTTTRTCFQCRLGK